MISEETAWSLEWMASTSKISKSEVKIVLVVLFNYKRSSIPTWSITINMTCKSKYNSPWTKACEFPPECYWKFIIYWPMNLIKYWFVIWIYYIWIFSLIVFWLISKLDIWFTFNTLSNNFICSFRTSVYTFIRYHSYIDQFFSHAFITFLSRVSTILAIENGRTDALTWN